MFEREWRFYLDDMIIFPRRFWPIRKDLIRNVFEADEKAYDATLRKLELIGEPATHIPEAIRETFLSIPWRQVIATRNRLIHGYLGIENDILWSIIRDDIPVLLKESKILKIHSEK